MILDEIVRTKLAEVATRRGRRPRDEVAAAARHSPPPRDLRRALVGPGLALIAEIKGASPSEGAIRDGFDPVALAHAYEAGGAAALSVLTDTPYFHGSWAHLVAVARASPLPVLCKEFIIDEYQIDEARAAGAAAVLLIVAILEASQLRAYLAHARQLGLAALVEVHTAEEVATAVGAGGDVIGINNRDLHTFQVDLDTTVRLRPLIPAGILVVSESGIGTAQDVARLRPYVDAVLVGTALMRSPDPATAVRTLVMGGTNA